MDDWTPEPLVAEQTGLEEAESEKLPIIVGYVTAVGFASGCDILRLLTTIAVHAVRLARRCGSQPAEPSRTSPRTTFKPTKTTAPSTAPSAPSTRELFVSFGKGQSSGIDWSDITGAETSINASQFGSIKSIYFEVTLSIPSTQGIAYARLYNASDAKPVEGSDVSTTNSGATFLISQPIALEGTKLYKVQTKSTENKDVIISQSRIRVVLN